MFSTLLHSGLIALSLTCLSTCHPLAQESELLPRQHISPQLYDDLVQYAHLIDIAYCISPLTHIQPPFECDNGCSDFNDTVQVVFQWSSTDLDIFDPTRTQFPLTSEKYRTTGYIALQHPQRTILIVLRGTRSFKDTVVDLNADMVAYEDCEGCKVHNGFHNSFRDTWRYIQQPLDQVMSSFPEYDNVLVMGHSMGGAVSVLLTLEILKTKHREQVRCITMGQPMIGNKDFAEHVNSKLALEGTSTKFTGSLIRVTHKNDPVVKLPLSDNYIIGDRYAHTNNEIFINELGHQLPQLENVVYCEGARDPWCATGMKFTNENSEHLNYFRRMGVCGFGLPTF